MSVIFHLTKCYWDLFTSLLIPAEVHFQCKCNSGEMQTLPNETALNKYVISWTKLLSLFANRLFWWQMAVLASVEGLCGTSLATHNQRSESNRFPLPFPFPSKLYIMCMANLEEVMLCTKFFLVWLDMFWDSV